MMPMPPSLLDTDIASLVLRRHPIALARAQAYLRQYSKLLISIITRYEILRGLKVRDAKVQLVRFELACQPNGVFEVLPLTDAIVERAAQLYADLRRQGKLIPDNDILVAATALHHGLVLVTNNLPHFQRIPNLPVSNWAQ